MTLTSMRLDTEERAAFESCFPPGLRPLASQLNGGGHGHGRPESPDLTDGGVTDSELLMKLISLESLILKKAAD